MTAAISEEYKCLVDILTCLVCKGMVTQAHICPNCSKFYCLDCIIRQLAVEQTCLNCNKLLEVSMLVNCQKLCCQLSETLEKVSLKRPESTKNHHQKQSLYCGKHRLEKTYYCKTCQKPLCSDCSVLTQHHRGHEFIKLSLMRNTYQSKVHQKIDEINRVHKNIDKSLEMEEVIRHKKGANNQENLIKFQGSIKLLKQELKKTLKKVLNEGEKRLEQMSEKLVKWNHIYDSHMSRLKNCSKGKFVERQYDILERQLLSVLQKIDLQDQNDMNQMNLHRKVGEISVSCIQPIYEEFTFLIEEYSLLFGQEGFFYTQSVQTRMGLEWRLKVYPEGINYPKEKNIENHLVKKSSKNQEEYFAVFIEFVNGCVQTTRQKYSLSLINQGNYSKVFTREFESQFDIGQCWGYEHFIKLNQMYEDEYYNRDDDSLKIVLKICPSNYFQAARDQQALMKQKMATLDQKDIQLNQLKNSIQSDKILASTSSLINLGSLQREAL